MMQLFSTMRVSRFVVMLSVGWAFEASAQGTPEIDYLFPAGAQRGTSIEVRMGAEFVPGACRLEAFGRGVTIQPTDSEGLYRISVAADAPLGAAEVRLVATQGASPPFPFLVGDLPEIARIDDRRMPLRLPVVVNSRLVDEGTIDEYALELSAGQGLVCAATTRTLRSPVDVMLRMLDSSGRIVAEGFDHRTADELLIYRAPMAGRYILQVFDFQLTGGSRNTYRLTVTDGPWVDYAFPLGLMKDTAAAVVLHGWNLTSQGATTVEHNVPAQSSDRYVVQLPGGANRQEIPVGLVPERVEGEEPNDRPEHATELTLPVAVSGRLQAKGDRDVYSVMLDKGTSIAVDLDSAGLGFAADPVLTLSDAAGKMLQEIDDHQALRDPKLRFTASVGGRYFLTIRDRASDGGRDFVYRLHLGAPRPDVKARINSTNLMVHCCDTVNLSLIVDRLDGYNEEVEVVALDLPAGVSVAPQAVPAKTPATIQLPFVVRDKVAPVGGLIRIVVRSKNAAMPIERPAMIAESANATTGSSSIWLAVSPRIPFTLQTTPTILDAPRLAAFPFPVTVRRADGYSAPIRLVGVRPDLRGTVKPLSGLIPIDGVEGKLPLVLQHQVIEGTTHRCRVMGLGNVTGVDGKIYSVFHVADGSLLVGCQPSVLTLTASPAIVDWRPGDNLKLHVQLMRRQTMQPIKLRAEFDEAAEGVSCDAVEVASDRNEAVLTLKFAADAKLPPRSVMTLHAESSHDGLPIYGLHRLRLELQ